MVCLDMATPLIDELLLFQNKAMRFAMAKINKLVKNRYFRYNKNETVIIRREQVKT